MAFPELMNELFKNAKFFKESCIFPGHAKKLEQVVNKIKAVSDKVEKKRKADALDLKDKVALVGFMQMLLIVSPASQQPYGR